MRAPPWNLYRVCSRPPSSSNPNSPPDPTDERVYDLTPVREPGFEFVYDSGSGIQDVVVTSKRPTAVTALTAPKVRKRSRLFILVSLSDSCGGRWALLHEYPVGVGRFGPHFS